MMKFDKLFAKAKRAALKLAKREIERILSKPDTPAGVTMTPTDNGIILAGKGLKSRAVADPAVRDIAR